MNDTVRAPSCWEGCYDDGWQGEIVPEAFAHPAKVSRALIRRIYQHAFVEGWLVPGDVCCDPFGGIAGTALDAMWSGLTWIGVELEPRFVAFGQQNIDLWNRKYGSKPGFGSARILQGDSRRLIDVVSGAHCVVGSPPFLDQIAQQDRKFKMPHDSTGNINVDYGSAPGQLGAMREGTAPALILSSPPYAAISTGAGGLNTKPGADGQQSGRNAASPSQDTDQRYGETAGQLATMREGEAPACIVSSPPYAESIHGGNGIDLSKLTGNAAGKNTQAKAEGYGYSDGQLGSMPEGRFDAVVSSPPYEGSLAQDDRATPSKAMMGVGRKGRAQRPCEAAGKLSLHGEMYGVADGQVGAESGETFWSSARDIVAQCHQILRPGGHAIWVCKDFVRKGRRIPFSDQWQALCESEGFRLVCRHRAILVATHGTQGGMFGADTVISTAKKSFFRRLAEKKGSPPIDFEDVICLERVA